MEERLSSKPAKSHRKKGKKNFSEKPGKEKKRGIEG